jgi:hypothetical protein
VHAQGAGRKIAYAILLLAHASWLVAKSRSDFALPLVRAQGIAAESPQDLHWQIRGLGAESPVFLPGLGQKNAPRKYKSTVSMRGYYIGTCAKAYFRDTIRYGYLWN